MIWLLIDGGKGGEERWGRWRNVKEHGGRKKSRKR